MSEKNEMEKKKLGWTKVLKILLLIVFIVGMTGIGLYPLSDPILHVVVQEEEQKQYSFDIASAEVEEITEYYLTAPGIGNTLPKEIDIYHDWHSLCLDKIIAGEMPGMVELIDGDTIRLNEAGCEVLQRQAGSRLMERIVYAEWYLAACVILLIALVMIEEKFTPGNQDNHGPIYEIKRFFKDLIRYWQYIVYSAKADLKAEVANSYLNRLWWLLEPFFNMLVYVVVFGRVMGQSIENYATYVFCALLMWNYFSKTVNYSVKCVRNNRDIVTKVYVPKYVLLLSNMVLNLYKLLFSLIVLIGMMVIFQVQIGWNLFWVLPAYALMILFSFGVGMIFLHYGVYVDDLAYAVGILLQMEMFLTGIFYDTISSLKTPLNMLLMSLNPAALFIDVMRNALLYNKATNLPLLAVWFVLAFLITCIGVHTVYKNENGYVKVV